MGAGKNVGEHTAAALKAKGYQVALGSRKPLVELLEKDGYLPVAVDCRNPESIQTEFANRWRTNNNGSCRHPVLLHRILGERHIESDPLGLRACLLHFFYNSFTLFLPGLDQSWTLPNSRSGFLEF
ncbi:hypothetical protein C8J57DRAFT_1310301 [Mycena rebaudengoi]|nr:hypothetical protein C8J57DRAFT_1310301 [Mycena rebaudengoi]